mgnify:CR=1 FL=1
MFSLDKWDSGDCCLYGYWKVISRYLGMFSLDDGRGEVDGEINRLISRYLGMFSLDITEPEATFIAYDVISRYLGMFSLDGSSDLT